MHSICFLSTCQFNEFAGGLDRVCCLLSREFIRRGYSIVYVYGNPSVLGRPAEGCEGEGQYQFPYTIWDDRNIAFFSEVVAKHNVDIVIDAAFIARYHDVAYQAKQKTPFKLITTYHGDPLCDLKEIRDKVDCLSLRHIGFNLFVNKIRSCLKYPISYYLRLRSLKSRMSKMVGESDYYVVLCEDYANIVRKITRTSRPDHIVAISNPIDLGKIEKSSVCKRNKVLFVGRLNEQKRVDRLLRIWQRVEQKLNGWDLVIVGNGDARGEYEEYAQRLHLKTVRFVGAVNSSEEMIHSKIVTMVSSHEGFGMTLVEGMAVGTIPMAFDSYEALRDIIDDGVNGYRIKPWKEADFANQIVELANDSSLWNRMSLNAMEKVKNFDVKNIVDKWENLFNVVISK